MMDGAEILALTEIAATERAARTSGPATTLIDFLHRELARRPRDRVLLDDARSNPSAAGSAALADVISERAHDDPHFAAELTTLRARVMRTDTDRTPVRNSVTGDVRGSVVQARDIHGSISFGDQRA